MASLALIPPSVLINNNNSNNSSNSFNSQKMTNLNNSSSGVNSGSSSGNDKFHCVAGSTPFVRAKEGGKVYKEATRREKEFYDMLERTPKSLIHSLMPRYYGVYENKDKEYIILQDLTHGYSKPCIMDIKLGLSHHDIDLATLIPKELTEQQNLSHSDIVEQLKQRTQISGQKKSWLASKYITTPLLGFCLCGFQKYNPNKKEFEKTTKEQGRYLNTSTIETKLFDFFSNGSNLNRETLKCIIQKLKLFKDYFETNPEYRFRSSSLLIIYEGDPMVESTKCELKMIDFAHANHYPSHIRPYSSLLSNYIPPNQHDDDAKGSANGQTARNDEDGHIDSPVSTFEVDSFFPVDGGYLFGVSNLLTIFQSLLVKYKL